MEETFNMQNGRLLLTEQGVDIRYSRYYKIYLVVISLVYAVWGPLKINQYIGGRNYQDLIIALLIAVGFMASLYWLMSLSRNNFIDYDTIRRITIKKGSIIDRVVVRFELKSGKRKKIFIDYNEYVMNSIESLFEVKGIEVIAKWKTI